jgi:hypothetical protein
MHASLLGEARFEPPATALGDETERPFEPPEALLSTERDDEAFDEPPEKVLCTETDESWRIWRIWRNLSMLAGCGK